MMVIIIIIIIIMVAKVGAFVQLVFIKTQCLPIRDDASQLGCTCGSVCSKINGEFLSSDAEKLAPSLRLKASWHRHWTSPTSRNARPPPLTAMDSKPTTVLYGRQLAALID